MLPSFSAARGTRGLHVSSACWAGSGASLLKCSGKFLGLCSRDSPQGKRKAVIFESRVNFDSTKALALI